MKPLINEMKKRGYRLASCTLHENKIITLDFVHGGKKIGAVMEPSLELSSKVEAADATGSRKMLLQALTKTRGMREKTDKLPLITEMLNREREKIAETFGRKKIQVKKELIWFGARAVKRKESGYDVEVIHLSVPVSLEVAEKAKKFTRRMQTNYGPYHGGHDLTFVRLMRR